MTLTATTVKLQFNGDGTTVSFPISFVFWDVDDLNVILTDANDADTDWVRGTQYEITRDTPTGATTGTLTVNVTPTDYTPASGERLTAISSLADTQETSIPGGGAFPTAAVEQRLDQITRLVQQHSEEISRCMKFLESELAASIGDLPSVSLRASQFLAFDSDGAPIAAAGASADLNAVSAFIDTLLDDADAATARNTLDVSQPDFESVEQTVTADTKLDVAHGLGEVPTFVQLILRNKTADLGYIPDDEVMWGATMSHTDNGVVVFCDATNVSIVQGAGIQLIDAGTFNSDFITVASWQWVVKAWL